MARGTRVGALFLWLAGVGCGSSPPASQEGEPEETGQIVPVAESDSGTPPSEGHAEAAPVDSSIPAVGDAGTEDAGTVPEPTCIPSIHVATPVDAQACAIASVWPDGRRQEAHYDPDGRLLELRTSDSSGALRSVETHVWQDGVELQRQFSYAGGRFDQTDWTYDAHRRPILRVDQGSRFLSTEYDYNYESGLGWSYTHDSQGMYVSMSDYFHDAQGRLTGIQSDSAKCDLDLNRCETRSYWPNGQLRSHHWSVGYNQTFSEEYNELGRLIGSTWANGSGGATRETTHTYDSAGRLSRSQTRTGREFFESDALSTRVYTKGGWRERFVEDSTQYPTNSNPDLPLTHTHRSTTQRARFLCGSSAVALHEWDINEDGLVDARRKYTRDRMGRLVHEDYSGTPGLDDGPLSRDFFYDCY